MSDLKFERFKRTEIDRKPRVVKEIEARVERIYNEYQAKKCEYLSSTKNLFSGNSKKEKKPENRPFGSHTNVKLLETFVEPRPYKRPENCEPGKNSLLERAHRTGVLKLPKLGLTEIPDYVWTFAIENNKNLATNDYFNSLSEVQPKPLVHLDLSFNVIPEFTPKAILESLRILWIERSLLQNISERIGSFKELRVLLLTDNLLMNLPHSIGYLSKLEELYLGKNMFCKIPNSVFSLTNLRKLNVSFNELPGISSEIKWLTNLEELIIAHNCVSVLPAELQKLPALRFIDFSYNCVIFLPNLSDMPCLHTVNASYNSLLAFPTFNKCANLTVLNLEHNKLQELSVGNLAGSPLKALLLGKNRLRSLPDDIHLLAQLTELDLHNNRIKKLPHRLSLIKTLSALNVDANAVDNVDDEALESVDLTLAVLMDQLLKYETIQDESLLHKRSVSLENLKRRSKNTNGQLVINNQDLHTISETTIGKYAKNRIDRIDLSKNKFSYVPQKIRTFKDTVTELVLRENCLKSLPDFLGQMENLKRLDVSSNLLEELPKSLRNSPIEVLLAANNRFRSIIPKHVYTMKKLRCINFSDNKITKIDAHGLRKLKSLSILHLSNNLIKEIPVTLLLLNGTIKRLTLFGNPLTSPPQSTLEEGTEGIMAYLRCKKEEERKNSILNK